MSGCRELMRSVRMSERDEELGRLYAPDGKESAISGARDRVIRVINGFAECFGENANAVVFSAPGRTEIGGNHTDHQRGRVLCGSVNVDMLACAAVNRENRIRIRSEGYPVVDVALDELAVQEKERNTSAALVRGVSAALARQGESPVGFDAYVVSDVLSGSGLSSSAAYEVLVGTILNYFGCNNRLSALQIAAAGQYAENVHFGKPCGMMDQVGSAVGGTVAIDFENPDRPLVNRVEYDFNRCGHALCIVDTGSCHADLTEDYAAVPREMGAVAECFGKQVLRQVQEEEFLSALSTVRRRVGDRAVLRAIHFFEENRRAAAQAQRLALGDFEGFLELVNASGRSSEILLQNLWSPERPEQQAVGIALEVGKRLLCGKGAIRVHGGGFAGTIQAFVPMDQIGLFREGMEAVLGTGSCHILRIRPQGGCVVLE